MAGGNKKVQYDIEGNAAGFEKAMEQAAAAAAAGSAAIQSQFGAVGDAFKSVFSHLGAIAGLLAGGAAFGKGVETTKELTGEAMKLSKTLGINVEDASRLNVALRSVGSSADVFTDATSKLVKQVRTNEDALKAMGLKTRDANGQFLNGQQLMQNSLATLATYREGTDRLAAAQVFWGKGAQEAATLLKLNAKVMEEARQKAESLGLVIGPEQAARTKAYGEAMHGVKLVFTGLQNAIGQAVMPVLTELAGYFNEAGPAAVAVMRDAMVPVVTLFQSVASVGRQLWSVLTEAFKGISEVVATVFGREIPGSVDLWKNSMIVISAAVFAARSAIELALELVRSAVAQTIAWLKTFANVAVAALSLDWNGVQAAWRAGMAGVDAEVAKSVERIKAMQKDAAAGMRAILLGEDGAGAAWGREGRGKPSTGGRAFVDPKAGGGTDQGDLVKAQFALARAKLEAELTVLREYLAEAQATYDDAYKRNEITTRQFYDAKLAIEQEALKKSIEIKRAELAEVGRLLGTSNLKEADKLGLQAQQVKITAELTVATAKLADAEIRNNREATEVLRQKSLVLKEIQRTAALQVEQSLIEGERINAQRQLAMREITNAQLLVKEREFLQREFEAKRIWIDKAIELERDDEKRNVLYAQREQLERDHQVRVTAIVRDMAIERTRFEIAAQDAIEQSVEGSFANIARRARTVKEAFMDVVGTIEAELAKLAARNVFRELFGGVAGGGGNGNWLGALMGQMGIPSFDVGTPYVPQDTFAMVHKGERIIPAKDNAAGSYGGGGVTVHQTINFNSTGAVDRRTQQQVAAAAWQGAMQAARRGT